MSSLSNNLIIISNMNVNYPVFIFLLLMCRVVEMNFVEADYSFSEGDFKNVENFDLADSMSTGKGDLSLGRKKEKSDFELKEFYHTGDSICQGHIDKYNKLLKTIDNYIQRYVSLFLISSKLHDYKIHDTSEIINADLDLFITGEDLAFLQGYSKSRVDSSIFKDLHKLDDIFEKNIRISEKGFLKETLKSAKSLFSFDYSFFLNQSIQMNYLYPVSFLLIVAVNWYFFRYPFRRFPVVVLIVNSLILWEGFITYFKKVKNADLENLFRLRQYDGNCDLENQRWYQSITNLIFGNKCLQYQKAISHNSMEEVFLLDSIVNAYAFYLIRTPFKILGSSVADLTGEITSTLPWPFNILFYMPILTFFVIVLLLYLLILRGTRLRLSFYGCGLEMGRNSSVTAGPEPSTSTKKPQPVLPTRKLKGLISSKFPRRLDTIATEVRRRKNSQIVREIKEDGEESEWRDESNESIDAVQQS